MTWPGGSTLSRAATAQPLPGLHATFNSRWRMGSVMHRQTTVTADQDSVEKGSARPALLIKRCRTALTEQPSLDDQHPPKQRQPPNLRGQTG